MKKLRTAIALFLLFVTTCTFCINAYAENVPLLYINAGYGEENGVAEVELKIKNNKGISAYSVIVNYDPDMLTFIELRSRTRFPAECFTATEAMLRTRSGLSGQTAEIKAETERRRYFALKRRTEQPI